jgi:hypothetical protein
MNKLGMAMAFVESLPLHMVEVTAPRVRAGG